MGGKEKEPSHYEILGVQPTAKADEIKKAYRKLALTLHPDKRGSDVTEQEANDRFQRLVLAHKVLSDEIERKVYDEENTAAVAQAHNVAPEGRRIYWSCCPRAPSCRHH